MTPGQTLLLWRLLGRGGQALQKDFKPGVKAPDRKALMADGLLKTDKGPRGALALEITDKGWRYAAEHLRDPLHHTQGALQDWLTLLHRFLEQRDISLADFVTASGAAEKEQPRKRELRARIEQAYLAITGGRKAEAVPLAKIRAQLADLDRELVDDGLRRIHRGDKIGDGKARLGQFADPKALTQEDRDATWSAAGEPYHLLWIEP